MTKQLPKHFFRVKIKKESILPRYEQELKATLQVKGCNLLTELVDYSRSLFQDCLTFIKLRTNSVDTLTVKLEFLKNQADLNIIQKRISKVAHGGEKPKYPPNAFIHWNNSGATVFVNFGYFSNLLKNNDCQTFIITLADNYIHELTTYFYKSMVEQEVHDIQCELLETFLGVILPAEAKAIQSSEFYYEEEDR